ncbi:apolipoprotein N-acyltransferase [uncultured Microbacterium sp.]|uniref:apolipoprotein N-acyltransferase n=1 Tax=uncultured Microbacterium sp. TaxID=191216 RepID=UPI0028DBBAA4|nr:apolipoprotein N-acyltransferase [uncultured Microbacterium sp.]
MVAPGARRALPLPVALTASVLAGASLDLAYPDLGWWPFAFLSVSVGLWTLVGRSLPTAFLVSGGFGAAFYLLHLSWVVTFLGPLPWLALAGLQSILFGAGGVLIALAYRLSRARGGVSELLIPVWVAGLWVLRETLMGAWPYGGFPWSRVGLTLVDSPFADTASWTGATGLSFLVVLVCASALDAALRRRWQSLVASVALLVAMYAVPLFPTESAGTLRLGWVQADGPSGYFDAKEPGDILDAHLRATEPLRGQDVDLLVWPEGSVDADPLNDWSAAARLEELVETSGTDLLLNAATTRGDETFNTSLLWTSRGAEQLYDKAHPVPFGEYVPDRWFYETLAPDLVGLIQREYTPGSTSPTMDTAGTRIGLAICFDVIYDDVIYAAAVSGAELYVLQTNNADFRGTDENLQQLAIARMRAIETGRTVANISTTGRSQIITKAGTVTSGLPENTTGARISEVALNSGTTPAVLLMPTLAPTLSAASILWFAAFPLARRLSPHSTPKDRRAS